MGPVDTNSDAIAMLRERLGRHPMLGFAVPRVGCNEGCCFVRLCRHGVGVSDWLPRCILADLPESELVAETLAPCVLVAPQVSANFGPVTRQFEAVPAAMLHYMASARRCGFRTAVCNRAVVGIEGLRCESAVVETVPGIPTADRIQLHDLVPDLDRTWDEFRARSWEQFERLCTAAHVPPRKPSRPSLLLDVRGVGPMYNGTTQAVLGIAAGLKTLPPTWDAALLADPWGARFHDLSREYADWPVYTTPPDRPFTATLRPSQPWHIQEMMDLHRASLVNVYLVLDTILWDIAYRAPAHLDGTWQFMAEHADAFLFDSDFTRARFAERFPRGGSAPGIVTHLSFDPSEYVRADALSSNGPDGSILVIGNDLDHKDVKRTVEALASAFPFRRINALGPGAPTSSPFVVARHSGELPELDLHRLYANAGYIVYPSFYEGFGFPIVTALAYGRTVLARGSALLDEVAAQCDPHRGRLVTFDRREDLVELLGRLIHGEPVPEHPLGSSVANGPPRAWRDVAQQILEFIEAQVGEPSRSRWIARERVVQQLLACRG
jgi:glycosyltransferase involved in cell wall biosynthesis